MNCRTKHCRGIVHKSCRSPWCAKCKAKRWKAASPVGYFYHKLRTSANRRKILFLLTRQKFAELWNGGLAANHGKTKFCLSVDRVRNSEGYHDDNVQLLTLSQNVRKQFVQFFRDQAQMDAEIAETSRKIRAEYPELCEPYA